MTQKGLRQHFSEKEWTLLEARAKRAQQVVEDDSQNRHILDVLRVFIANEQYALPVDNILAVYESVTITPLPGTPAHIAGITNLRGNIVPVLELSSLLNLATPELQPESVLVLVTHREGQVAVRVDALDEVGNLIESHINPVASDDRQTRSYVKGVLINGTILLDVQAILDDPALIVDQD
jgi:purine-binding chemotaxis protein CheW